MQSSLVEKVLSNPKYHELVKTRSKFAYTLSALMLLIYYGFIMIIAFAPDILRIKLAAGLTTSIGIPIGLGVIVSAFILTGIYVQRANGEFDRITNELKREVL